MTDHRNSNLFATRRRVLAGGISAFALSAVAGTGLGGAVSRPAAAQMKSAILQRTIPSTGLSVPAVGLGSWITFNVGDDPVLRADCAEVMDAFFQAGGTIIDSSPMYGSAQDVIGAGLARIDRTASVFSADKVWIGDTDEGRAQIGESLAKWQVPRFDLLQVHNLVGWEAHLETLAEMKASAEVRHIGITTSHGRRHGLFERVMEARDLDFIQVTYNPVDREVEERILSLARERDITVLVNRPFRRGALPQRLDREPLPGWAAELGADTWAQLVLKFILSHPAATIPIPATTQPHHARENVAAAAGPLPDPGMREKIAAAVRDL